MLLPELVADFESGARSRVPIGTSAYSFHVVQHRQDGLVDRITDVHGSDLWVNGGYFIFRQEIFDFIGEGEDLLAEPFRRLIEADELITYRYAGFWTAMDTLKDLEKLRTLHESGRPPWALWLTPQANGPAWPPSRHHCRTRRPALTRASVASVTRPNSSSERSAMSSRLCAPSERFNTQSMASWNCWVSLRPPIAPYRPRRPSCGSHFGFWLR